MNGYRSNGCTPKFKRTGAAMVAGTTLFVTLGTTTAAATPDRLPDPDPVPAQVGVSAGRATQSQGPPSYPQYDERYEVDAEPVADAGKVSGQDSDGFSGQWVPLGASAVAALGLAGGGWWLYRRRGA